MSGMSLHLRKHEAVQDCGGYEVWFDDSRRSKFFYFDDLPNRRLRPDIMTTAQALEARSSSGVRSPRPNELQPSGRFPFATHPQQRKAPASLRGPVEVKMPEWINRPAYQTPISRRSDGVGTVIRSPSSVRQR
jgi:hypothetical protein